MRDACRVEVVFGGGGGKHFMTLPERIWQRGDLLLAAAGSLACVRALYLRAAELGKLHQFLPCPLTRADYAAGRAAEHLAARLREAARRPGVGGVVLYASCAEVLTQCDLEQVAEQAGLPVRILLRGPLVARTRNAVAELEQILSTFPPACGGNSPGQRAAARSAAGFQRSGVPSPELGRLPLSVDCRRMHRMSDTGGRRHRRTASGTFTV